ARQIVRREAQHSVRQEVLVGQRDAVGEWAVGVQRDYDTLLEIALKGMFRHRRHDVRVHVARQAHFERNLSCHDFLEERRVSADARRTPASGASIACANVNAGRCRSGEYRTSTYRTFSAALSRTNSYATRSSAAAVCRTERVISYLWRYSSRLFASRTSIALASASGVSAGKGIPCARASSSIVAGRSAPSRCTCSSALGQPRNASLVRRGLPSRRAETTTR